MARKKILCVCAGNTCRSPMLAALLQDAFDRLGKKYKTESAGYTDEAFEHKRAAPEWEVVRRRGETTIDLREHVARHVSEIGDLSRFSLILGLSPRAKEALIERGVVPRRIRVVNAPDGVPDPYGLGQKVYDECFKTLHSAVKDLVRYL